MAADVINYLAASFVAFAAFRYLTFNFNAEKIDNKQPVQRRANAVILILCRNSDLNELLPTLADFERTFNAKFNYPYVFLNDKLFTEEFKEQVTDFLTRPASPSSSSRTIKFGQVPIEHWSYPPWIDQQKATKIRKQMHEARIPNGGTESYRHMCRFFSGFFYKHPLLQEYDYYWRVEPGVKFFCEVDEDPFVFMADNKIDYGFILIGPETKETVPTFWATTRNYIKEMYPKITGHKLTSPLLEHFTNTSDIENVAANFTICQFWNNFEIASFKFFRSELYQSYFDYLDKAGGFFYERWGDAPVRLFAASMFLNASQMHHFSNMGYQHDLYMWCPKRAALMGSPCSCGYYLKNNFANPWVGKWYLCNVDFLNAFNLLKRPNQPQKIGADWPFVKEPLPFIYYQQRL